MAAVVAAFGVGLAAEPFLFGGVVGFGLAKLAMGDFNMRRGYGGSRLDETGVALFGGNGEA